VESIVLDELRRALIDVEEKKFNHGWKYIAFRPRVKQRFVGGRLAFRTVNDRNSALKVIKASSALQLLKTRSGVCNYQRVPDAVTSNLGACRGSFPFFFFVLALS
jgi:hypothetical protein